MSEFTSSFKVLIFLILIIGFMLGLVSKKRLGKFISGLIFIPIVLMVLWNSIKGAGAAMDSPISILLAIGILVVGALLALRLLLGDKILHTILGNFIYDILKWLVLLPFRLLKWLIELASKLKRPY